MKFGTELYGLRVFLFTTVFKTNLNPILSFTEGSELLSAVVEQVECQDDLHLMSWLSICGAILHFHIHFQCEMLCTGENVPFRDEFYARRNDLIFKLEDLTILQ